jgi:hypothetical protein
VEIKVGKHFILEQSVDVNKLNIFLYTILRKDCPMLTVIVENEGNDFGLFYESLDDVSVLVDDVG